MTRMSRQPRQNLSPGYFHCINRSVGRATIFHSAADYESFQHLTRRKLLNRKIEIAAYCLMPNHWHFVLAVHCVDDMSKFFAMLLNAHTRFHHARFGTVGHGPIYQGRYKAIPLNDVAVIPACRYVERNPVASGLVRSAADWPWSSHRFWLGLETRQQLKLERPFVESPERWQALTDTCLTTEEIEKINGLTVAQHRQPPRQVADHSLGT